MQLPSKTIRVKVMLDVHGCSNASCREVHALNRKEAACPTLGMMAVQKDAQKMKCSRWVSAELLMQQVGSPLSLRAKGGGDTSIAEQLVPRCGLKRNTASSIPAHLRAKVGWKLC